MTLALGLAASISSFAAPCTQGATLAQLSGCSINVTNGSNSWNLTNWALENAGAVNFGAAPTASDITVTWATYTVGSQFGFSVTMAPGAGTNFFRSTTTTVPAGTQTQTSNLRPRFDVAGVALTSFGVSLNNIAVTGAGRSDLTKCNYVGGSTCNETVSTNESTSAVLSTALANLTNFTTLDQFQTTGGIINPGSISIGSFTNYFLPAAATTGTPEPMSFVLMGAGLVGIAALRRRS